MAPSDGKIETVKTFTEDEICAFGEPLLETHCKMYADYTVGFANDLDHQCYCAVDAIMHGGTLQEAQAFIDLEHPGGDGARTTLTDLFGQWHDSVPA